MAQNGYLRPFELIPVVEAEFVAPEGTARLMTARELRDGSRTFQTFGAETRPYSQFHVNAIRTTMRMAKRYPSECWIKPTTLANFDAIIREGAVVRWGRKPFQQAEEGMAKRSLQILGADKAPPELVASELKQLGFECDGSCEGWTMISAISLEDVAPLDLPPFDGTLQPLPWEVVIIAHVDPTVAIETLGPALRCAGPDGKLDPGAATATKVGEEVYSNPWVAMYDVQLDSARLATSRYTEKKDHSTSWQFVSGNTAQKAIELLADCKNAVCWEGTMAAPQEAASIRVQSAWSSTRLPRASVRALAVAGDVSSIGRRQASVHGFFDRSSVDVFTAVPSEFVVSGISQPGFDFRASAKLDWGHDPGFSEPNNVDHIDASRPSWLDRDQPLGAGGVGMGFFGDWSRERVQLRRRSSENLSFCTQSSDQSVVVEALTFFAGGLSVPTVVPMTRFFGFVPILPGTSTVEFVTAGVIP